MMERAAVQHWLDAYVRAWKSNDPAEIAALFSADAVYFYHPYDAPVSGHDAIVASWLEPTRRDPPGTYDAHYEPIVIEGQVAVAHGRSRYFEADGTSLKTEFDNLFVIHFDDSGHCTEFREWYMERR